MEVETLVYRSNSVGSRCVTEEFRRRIELNKGNRATNTKAVMNEIRVESVSVRAKAHSMTNAAP